MKRITLLLTLLFAFAPACFGQTIDFCQVAGTTLNPCVDTYATLQSSVTRAGSLGSIFYITGVFAVPSNTILPANITLVAAGGQLQPSVGVTLTVNGLAVGSTQLFGGAGTVSLPGTVRVQPEWFGAAGDWNGTTGTDDTAAIQKAINSLKSGCVQLSAKSYRITATLNITTSNTGICGVSQGFGYQGNAGTSIFALTSSTATGIALGGPNAGAKTQWNILSNFALQRTVLPTGTATGISIDHAAGIDMHGVNSADSIRCFYLHDAPNYSTGPPISNSQATWGDLSVTSYTTETLYGWYIDSADGTAMNSQTLFQCAAASSGTLTNTTIYGMYEVGKAINDFETDWFFAYETTYGQYIVCSATPNSCSDNHFINSIVDSWGKAGITVSGVSKANIGSVDISGGWFGTAAASGPTSKAIDIESSSGGVTVEHAQILTNSQYGIYVGSSSAVVLNGNYIMNTTNAISLNSTTDSVVIGNQINNQAPGGTGIGLTSSTGNAITGNSLQGNGVYGILADSTSTNNVVSGNVIDAAAITNPYSGPMSQPATVTFCTGGTASCTKTYGPPHSVVGFVTLSAGSATVSNFPPYTSISTFWCTATDNTAAAAVKWVPVNGSSFTLTGTGTDVIVYSCTGY